MKIRAESPPPVASSSFAAITATACHDERGGGGGVEMADLAYGLLLIGGFALLVMIMRGLQRL